MRLLAETQTLTRAETRFWKRVMPEPNSGCWLWLGSARGNGYGGGLANGKNYRAHRFAYERCVGLIPNGLTLDHLCRNRICVNPKHLEPVTSRENNLRGIGWAGVNAKKTHCLRGHEYTAQNTMWRKNGCRYCRTCRRLRAKAGRRASREEVVGQESPSRGRAHRGRGVGNGSAVQPQQEA